MKGTLAYSWRDKQRVLGSIYGRITIGNIARSTGMNDREINQIVEELEKEGRISRSVHHNFITKL